MAPQSTYSQRHHHMSTPYPLESSTARSHHTHNSNNQALTIPQLLHPSPLPTTANQTIQPQQPRPTASTHTPHDVVFSPDNIPLLDEYGQDPRFLELQQELRCLLFTGARSRRGSTSYDDESSSSYRHEEAGRDMERRQEDSPQLMKQIITSGKMAGYLKNYMAEVAPWVRDPNPPPTSLYKT